MSKTFRDWDCEQTLMFPPSVLDFVPEGHLAHFVRETAQDSLDLSAILSVYSEERGYPPYHPVMMTALLLYAYTQGIYSSRRISKACQERVDFMAVTALQRPDFRTVSDFRKRHLEALRELFVQVLRLCQQAGLVKLGHVALDGTKMKANASKHKAMSYGRMKKVEPELAAVVQGWLDKAQTAKEVGVPGVIGEVGHPSRAWTPHPKPAKIISPGAPAPGSEAGDGVCSDVTVPRVVFPALFSPDHLPATGALRARR
jgi:transposase